MTSEEALAQLGATTELLTDEQRTRLDDQGYLPLPGILSEAHGCREYHSSDGHRRFRFVVEDTGTIAK